jgi:hypothetical protein
MRSSTDQEQSGLGDRAMAKGSSPRQVVLGLFIVGQLAFLVLSNFIGLYHDAQGRLSASATLVIDRIAPGYASQSGHAWKVPDEVSTALRRWAQLTGQDQSWSLFAPSVAKVTGFPALLLIFEDEPASAPGIARVLTLLNARDGIQAAAAIGLLQLRPDAPPALDLASFESNPALVAAHPEIDLFLSDNEPDDPHHFLRVGKFRLRRYESGLILYLNQYESETNAEAHERWGSDIRQHVSEYADQLFAYMRWRLAVYQQRHPDRPTPRQVILVERSYFILPPDDETGRTWRGPRTVPLARWQPQATWQNDYRPIERYNPVTRRFEAITR